MKPILSLLAAALLSTACLVTPKPAPPPVAALRPMAVHTCVAGASVWLDGAGVPALRDTADANGNVTFLKFPATIAVFNLHATAPGMPEYGVVLTTIPSTDPLIILLGACTK
jgi:hypothetical protein